MQVFHYNGSARGTCSVHYLQHELRFGGCLDVHSSREVEQLMWCHDVGYSGLGEEVRHVRAVSQEEPKGIALHSG